MLPPRFSFSAFLEDAGEAYVIFGSTDPQATVGLANGEQDGEPDSDFCQGGLGFDIVVDCEPRVEVE
ncbi:MAG: hypothetical protein Q8Q00_12845 [Dehalococcoidia bacterium]|nr:hypothetical protein [Dehalococcoidia bacterium]